jgi:tetratricopeptide (TPR) repeat protein
MAGPMTLALGLALLLQAPTPSSASKAGAWMTMDEAGAERAMAADRASARAALDDLLTRFDASIHSDRQKPEQRQVDFDEQALAAGVRLGAVYARATGDRTYERRFRARAERIEGTRLLNDRRYEEATTRLRGALGEAVALHDDWLETITRVNLAYGYLELGRMADALGECERAAKVAERIDDRARGLTLFNLGSMYLHMGDYRKAIDYCTQAAVVSHRVNMKLWEGNALLNVGASERQLGDLPAARQTLERARVVLEQTGDRLGQGRVYFNLAVVANEQRQYAEAAGYLERALPIIRDVDIRHSHEIEREPTAYRNPLEESALQMLADAYTNAGMKERAERAGEELRALRARPQPAPSADDHEHRP